MEDGVKLKVEKLNEYLLKVNMLWVALSPLLLAIILIYLKLTQLFILKDLVFYFSILFSVFIVRTTAYYFFFIKLGFFLFFLLFISVFIGGLHGWLVYNLRQLFTPILIFGFGYHLNLNHSNRLNIINFIYKLSAWLVFIGLLFKILDIWEIIDLTNYFNAKGIPVNDKGLSYMFYEPAFDYIERMVSTILDPISFGHLLAAPIILAFYKKGIEGRKRKILLTILFTGLIFTFSKGALLQVVLALFLFNKRLPYLLRYLVPTIFIIMVFVLINIKGILIHIIGFTNAIIYANLLGHGIGLVGNYAKMFADDLTVYHQYKISDTFIGSVLGQIGIIGFFLWISFFKFKLNSMLKSKTTKIGACILISQLIVSILSENTLNFTSFFIPGILSGMLIRGNL